MKEKSATRRLCALSVVLVTAMLLPVSAGAETRTFVHTSNIFPTGGALTEGPANEYPSGINVSGLSGTVTKVTVTLIGYTSSSPDDVDAVIVGPNGQQVMLVSDACGVNPSTLSDENWTFDDSAPTFVSDNGPCSSFQDASYKPSNYEDPSLDNLTPGGGPAGPYLNRLSLLAGGSPDGAWNLFVFDDNPAYHGFDLSAWALNLEIQPPAAPALTTKRKKCKKAKKRSAAAAKRCKKK